MFDSSRRASCSNCGSSASIRPVDGSSMALGSSTGCHDGTKNQRGKTNSIILLRYVYRLLRLLLHLLHGRAAALADAHRPHRAASLLVQDPTGDDLLPNQHPTFTRHPAAAHKATTCRQHPTKQTCSMQACSACTPLTSDNSLTLMRAMMRAMISCQYD